MWRACGATNLTVSLPNQFMVELAIKLNNSQIELQEKKLDKKSKDRLAILSMVGEYRVSF